MYYSIESKNKAIQLRKEGYSLFEISRKLGISKSTASLWLRDIVLKNSARKRLSQRSLIGYKKGQEILKRRRNVLRNEIKRNANKSLQRINLNNETKKLLCSLLFWAEGAKIDRHITFINSDPIMVKTFLKLLRSSFPIVEEKFRILVHVHEYHNNESIKSYWLSVTKIPLSKFNKTYLKPNTRKRIRKNYNGTVSIRYYDHKIAKELRMIYNNFAQMLGA